MAEGVAGTTILDQVVRELEVFSEYGREEWQSSHGSFLPCIESLAQDGNGEPESEQICASIEEACRAVEGKWSGAALQHLGFATDSPPAKTNRESNAARKLDGTHEGRMSDRVYRATKPRDHKGRRFRGKVYISWSEVTLTLVAEQLIRAAGRDPEEPWENTEIVVPQSKGHRTANGVPREQRVGDKVRKQIAKLYQPIRPKDFEDSFFHRPSTDTYIEALVALPAVTIYAGAGVSADVHAPFSDELMHWSLLDRLNREDAHRAQLERERRIVDALARVYPPSYLGSIAREHVRQDSEDDPEELIARAIFVDIFKKALRAGRNTGGFLSFAIGSLAFAMRKAGKDPVRVLTTNYDGHIDEAEARVHEFFAELDGYSFEPYNLRDEEKVSGKQVPLYSLNGQLEHRGDSVPDPLIIGEADALTPCHEERGELQDKALTETACIFVGSSLSEADVLAKLVTLEYGQPRYAIVLTPELQLHGPEERATALNLIAQRFLHIGVVPIVIDYPHQAPQLLIEVALRLEQGESYKSYKDRLNEWWKSRAKGFGFSPQDGPDGGKRSAKLQQKWMQELAKARKNVVTKHLELPAAHRDRDEEIQVEVWLRHPETRRLFLWSTSEGIWENANTAHRCDIPHGDEFAAQRAFRLGKECIGEIKPSRGIWRYQLSFPLVLKGEKWRHLPVGVVSVLSSKGPVVRNDAGEVLEPAGRLAAFEDRDDFAADLDSLIDDLSGRIAQLLDK